MENVTLTQKEQARLQVLNSLLAEHMTLDQAATLMGVTTRHTRRILAAYRELGAAAVAHGHRGRRPPNATPEPVATAVVHLARTRYAGANHTHLSELLSEPGARGCRCERSSGSWESTGPPSRNTWTPRVLRRGMTSRHPRRHHLIPWQPDRVTSMLAAQTDIYPEQRQPLPNAHPRLAGTVLLRPVQASWSAITRPSSAT